VTHDDLDRIIGIVQSTGKLQSVDSSEDFYDAGFSSINALQLLMELEDAFSVAIPDDEFVTARTCASLHALISRLPKTI
jgi:acyl carrier protein